jgi:hypothetical protein
VSRTPPHAQKKNLIPNGDLAINQLNACIAAYDAVREQVNSQGK